MSLEIQDKSKYGRLMGLGAYAIVPKLCVLIHTYTVCGVVWAVSFLVLQSS